MENLKLDLQNSGIDTKEIQEYSKKVKEIHEELQKNKNNEDEFLGWIDLPENYDKEEFERIKKAAKKIQKDSDVLLVIGIGGSYLGARAVIESSNLNWSLPFPVAPWQIATAPSFLATSTSFFAIKGLAKDVPSKYLFS